MEFTTSVLNIEKSTLNKTTMSDGWRIRMTFREEQPELKFDGTIAQYDNIHFDMCMDAYIAAIVHGNFFTTINMYMY